MSEERATTHCCSLCDKSYSTKKSLSNHISSKHAAGEAMKWRHCKKQFSSKSSRQKHEKSCQVDRNRLWVPSSEINTNKVDDRHKHIKTHLNEKYSQILKLFQNWLSNGGYSSILVNYKRKLTGKSITTYTYHLRHFIQFIQVF